MDKSTEIKIRVYKAVNNLKACNRFAQGHAHVLKSYGIKKVTSANTSWFFDEGVFIIMVESLSGDKIYGGARLHIKNKEHSLPIENAIGEIDPKIYTIVNQYEDNKTSELCALWNSKDMSGTGLSVLLTRAGVAKAGIFLASKLKLESIYILCAPWTIQMVKNTGFTIEKNIGNNGTFIYPKPDLIASLLVIKDIDTLKAAKKSDRLDIFDLRKNPKQVKFEEGPKGKIEVEYDLVIPQDYKSIPNDEFEYEKY